MFGLMTVARHEREMAALRVLNADLADAGMARFCVLERCEKCRTVDPAGRKWAVVPSEHPALAEVRREADHWRALATKLADDMADLMKRQAPPVPGPDEAEIGAIADDDWTPSAIAKRERAVGAKS